MTNASRLFVALASTLVLVDCDDSCYPGYILKNHVCIAEAAPASATGGTGSNEDSGTSEDAGKPQETCSDSTFGNTCMTAADCGCDTAYCAGYPGQQGICSHSGCLENPSVCPSTWNCQDFSAFQTGLSLCAPP